MSGVSGGPPYDGREQSTAVDILQHQFGAVCCGRSSVSEDPAVDRRGAHPGAMQAVVFGDGTAIDTTGAVIFGVVGGPASETEGGTDLVDGYHKKNRGERVKTVGSE